MLLALLALAVPPAFAISDEAFNQVAAGPAAIEVSTSLDSCGILDDGVVCKLDVSFNSIPDADTYSATVTRADGSVIDYGGVSPGGTSLWVPYVGAGNYSVKITAYGEPDTPAEEADGHGDVIAVGSSNTGRNRGEARDHDQSADADASQNNLQTEATGGGSSDSGNSAASGEPSTDVGSSAEGTATTTTTPDCTATAPAPPADPPAPPEEPPADTDPDNPDEDADGIPDEQERAVYDQQMSEYQAAVAAQQAAAATPAC